MKPDWVAMCPEAEHLLSPRPVLMPGASVGCPRLGLGLRAGRGMVMCWLIWGLRGSGGGRVEAVGAAMESGGRLSLALL